MGEVFFKVLHIDIYLSPYEIIADYCKPSNLFTYVNIIPIQGHFCEFAISEIYTNVGGLCIDQFPRTFKKVDNP